MRTAMRKLLLALVLALAAGLTWGPAGAFASSPSPSAAGGDLKTAFYMLLALYVREVDPVSGISP